MILMEKFNANLKISKDPGRVAQLVGALPCTQKGHRFDSLSGLIPRFQVWSPVGACAGCNRSMFLSHINVLFLSFSFSLLSL